MNNIFGNISRMFTFIMFSDSDVFLVFFAKYLNIIQDVWCIQLRSTPLHFDYENISGEVL